VFARIKEAAVHTLVYGLGSVAQTLLGVLLVPLYTRAFTPAEFGVLTLVTLVGTLAGAVFLFGVPSALARSYYDYPEGDLRRRTITTSLAIVIAGAVVQVVLGIVCAAPLSRLVCGSPDYAPHVAVSVAASALSSIVGVCLVVLRFERRSVFVVTINVLSLIVTTAFILFFLFVRRDGIMAPLAGALAGQGTVCVVLLWAVRESFAGGLLHDELRVQLRYGLAAMLFGVTYYALDSADRILLARYQSAEVVGVYSLGYKIGMLIHVAFVLPFGQIWSPMRMQYREGGDAVGLFKVMHTYYWLVGLFATVAISLFAGELVMLAGTRAYLDAARVVPIVMLAHLAYGAVGIVDSGVVFTRKVSYHVYLCAAALVLNVALNVWLIPVYGYMAAAWVTLASYLFLLALMFAVSRRLYPQQLEARLAVLGISAAVVLIAGSQVRFLDETPAVLVKAAMIGALGLFWYVAVLSPPERGRLTALVTRFV